MKANHVLLIYNRDYFKIIESARTKFEHLKLLKLKYYKNQIYGSK